METIDMTPEEKTAKQVINDAVMENDDGTAILRDIQEEKASLEASHRATVDSYIRGMRDVYAEMDIDDFGGNTAGLYNGSDIFIDRRVLTVGEGDIDTTIDQSSEVLGHEDYHMENHHTAPMKVADKTRGDIAVVLGGKEFSQTALIEGLTVRQTGHAFVSSEYRAYESNLNSAMQASGLSIEDIEEAVNKKKDLTLIDDRTRETDDQESLATVS